MERRLAAILVADVVGYSRLMGADEAGTLEIVRARQRNVLEPLIAQHHGRIFKQMGDGLLVEFASAVNAVQCAAVLQHAMESANAGADAPRRIVLRIGINLGDVMVEGGDLYGDGVNVAARLQAEAEPGNVYLSRTVYRHVKGKVDLAFEDLGQRTVKNIAEPVWVYRIADGAMAGEGARQPAPSTGEPSAKPSVAILPFTNMSGDPAQDFFSDGLTEDIITELSRFRQLVVIARNSSFLFRGPAIDVGEVRRKLGVQYVVEGSVRKSGQRIRLTAQLIEAETQAHVWAERYDRELSDVFAIQDEIARTIAATLEGRIAARGAERSLRRPPAEWAAYEYFLKGRRHHDRYEITEAEACLERAIALDPSFPLAHTWIASVLLVKFLHDRQAKTLDRAEAAAHRALVLDDNNSFTHSALGTILMHRRQLDAAGNHFQRALALNPNDVSTISDYALWLTFTGHPAEALAELDVAIRRDPYPGAWLWESFAIAYFGLRRYRDAIRAAGNIAELPWYMAAMLTAAHAHLGELVEAKRLLQRALDGHTPTDIAALWGVCSDPAQILALNEGLRLADLPAA